MAEFNYIVRVIGKDLDGTKSIESGLQDIKGIGQRIGGIVANEFRKENSVPAEKRLGELTNEEIKKLEEIILTPQNHKVPNWVMNRQKDIETGKNKHLTMNELMFSLRTDLTRMAEAKSYKGLRHMWGLTVRGQKTKSRHRGKGGTVGVIKKDQAKPASKPAVSKEAKK